MSAKILYEHLLSVTATSFDQEDTDQLECICKGIAYNDRGILRPVYFLGPQTYANAVYKALKGRK